MKVISWKEFWSLSFAIARVYLWPWITFLFPFCTQVTGTDPPSLSQSNIGWKCMLAAKPLPALPGLEGHWKSKAVHLRELYTGDPRLLQAQKCLWKSGKARQHSISQRHKLVTFPTVIVCSLGSFGPTLSLRNYTILVHICENKLLKTNSSKYRRI